MTDQGALFDPSDAAALTWCFDCHERHQPGHHTRLQDPLTDTLPPVHRDGPDTELAAARLVRPKVGSWRSRVLAAFVADWAARGTFAGYTDRELVEQIDPEGHAGYSTIRSRRGELVKLGWLADSGTRRTEGERSEVVWVLSPAARHADA